MSFSYIVGEIWYKDKETEREKRKYIFLYCFHALTSLFIDFFNLTIIFFNKLI